MEYQSPGNVNEGYTLRRGPTRFPEPSAEEVAIDAANAGDANPEAVPF
jgi:hypothetical protein